MHVCGKTLQKCIFRRTVRSSKSLRPLRNAYDDREKEEQKFQTRMTFSLTKGGSFLILVLLSTDAGLSFFSTQQEEKKKFVRERETWQQKKERDFRFSLKRHAHKNHASSHITTGVLSSLRFSTTLFCDTTFRFRDKATKETTSSVFVPSFRDAVYTCS